MLRRKNTGLQGEILKGKAKDKFASILIRSNTGELSKMAEK